MDNEIETYGKIKTIMSNILDIDILDINDSSSPRSIQEWKGLKHRKIIEKLESEFDIRFSESEIETLVNFKIIKATVVSHLDLDC